MKITAVVVTHNRIGKLRETVERLLAEPLDLVLVFDNASSDGTAEWLSQQQDKRLVVLRSDRNLGGAGGFSEALGQASELTDPDWIVVMDDDGRPMPGAIGVFRDMDHTGWDAIGAAVLTPDGQVCEMNRPYRNPFWHLREFLVTLAGRGRRGFHLRDKAYSTDAGTLAIDMASFVGLFVSRKALIRCGLPDARLFIYGDDQLYTLRMRREGLRIGFAPQVRFEHDTATTQGSSGVVLRPIWKAYYMYRNALIAYRVAAGLWFWPLVPVLLFKWHRKAGDYGPDAERFRRILRIAVRDGLTGRLERSHDDVLRISKPETGILPE